MSETTKELEKLTDTVRQNYRYLGESIEPIIDLARRQIAKDKVVDVDGLVIYAYYTDDGPNGICGQAMSITTKWKQLNIFHDYEKFKIFAERVSVCRSRKNPRIEHYWVKDELSEIDCSASKIIEHI